MEEVGNSITCRVCRASTRASTVTAFCHSVCHGGLPALGESGEADPMAGKRMEAG